MPRPADSWHPEPAPMPVRLDRILQAGCLLWALAIPVTLLVPALHDGERHWWPTATITGLALGLLGWVLVRRGVGAVKDAARPRPDTPDDSPTEPPAG